MKFKPLFLIVFLTTVTLFSSAQTVDEVIDKYIQAMGGKEKIEALKTARITASIEIAPNVKAPMTMIIVDKKGFRMDLEAQGMKMTQAVYGDSGWAISPWGGKMDAEKMNMEEVQMSKDQMDIAGALFDNKVKGHTVELVDKEDMEGTEVYEIKITKKSGNIEYDFIDAASYLRLKETSTYKFQDKEVSSDVIYSDYRSVDGVLFPFNIEQRQAGGSHGQPMIVEKVEMNIAVDENIFKMPPPSPAAPAETK